MVLNLDKDEVDLLLASLAKLPLERSYNLFNKIITQVEKTPEQPPADYIKPVPDTGTD